MKAKDHTPGTCPFCERPDLYPIRREWNGVTLHGLNVPHPAAIGSLEHGYDMIGVEVICLKYDVRGN